MTTITSLVGTDGITTSNSMSKINTNFSNLNTDKIETSVIDTDTSLAANSDAKIPSQKAVKAYVDSVGTINASTSVRGVVEVATQAEVNAGTATGGTGASLVVSPDTLKARATITAAGTTTKDISLTTTTTIAHGLGATPTFVRIVAGTFSTTTNSSYTEAVYVNSTQSAIYLAVEGAAAQANGNAFRIYEDVSSPRYIEGTITVDSTNISIAWAKTGLPTGTVPLMWHAYV